MMSDPRVVEASRAVFTIIAEGQFEDKDELWATCADIEGFFTCPDNPGGRRFMRLLDCSVSGALLEYCIGRRGPDKVRSNARLQVLDLTGEAIGSYFMTVLGSHECTRGVVANREDDPAGPRYDVTLDIAAEGKSPAVKEIWQRWRHGLPQEKNLWAAYSSSVRLAWLDVVRSHDHPGLHSDAPPGTTFELDGQNSTDYAGLYCAIGEAVNGPGGYFGADLGALDDCLSGGFGAQIPFTLVWRDFDVALRHLSKPPYGQQSLCGGSAPSYDGILQAEKNDKVPNGGSVTLPYIDRVLEVLGNKGVSVVRA
jgi:RNAse (barnase) inhibitor barstar